MDFDKGLERLVELVEDKMPIKPVLVAVFAPGPHSGKTFLRSKLQEKLREKGYMAHGTPNYNSARWYASCYYGRSDAFILEIGIVPDYEQLDIDCINLDTRRIVDKDIDLTVLIYNPKTASPPLDRLDGLYDLVISNPEAEKKVLWLKSFFDYFNLAFKSLNSESTIRKYLKKHRRM